MASKTRGRDVWEESEVHRTLPGELERLMKEERLERVQEGLRALLAVLEEHFAEEERSDGLFGQLREDAPSFDPRIRKLEEDHATLLGDLRTLLERLDELSSLQVEVERRKRDFAAALRGHHQAEESLVLEAYMRDVGGG